ncbi:serine hydrolase [Alkanindiges illinoisensis]|uniref:serine hydrolase n=1 Tax=Alkanindiges illinoisensis TaxID=197183 RepID=UPI0038991718
MAKSKHIIAKQPKWRLTGLAYLSLAAGIMGMSGMGQAAVYESTQVTAAQGSGQVSWSADEASRLMHEDRDSSEVAVDVRQLPGRSGNLSTVVERVKEPVRQLGTQIVNRLQGQPEVSAAAALVLDAQTGEVLYSKNMDKALPIASISKLMTAVVTADARLDMAQRIVLQPEDFNGPKRASSTLRVGDEMNRAEVLLLALMKSENPAAAALARTYPGGKAAFMAAMNKKARDLGMTSTWFGDPTGLDARNVASAKDLGTLVRTAYQYGLIRQFTTTPHYDFNLPTRVLRSNNTNALVREGNWNIGLSKTGYINEAGRCVVMQANINQRPTVVVLLGASSSAGRTNDANRIFTWLSGALNRYN